MNKEKKRILNMNFKNRNTNVLSFGEIRTAKKVKDNNNTVENYVILVYTKKKKIIQNLLIVWK